jgi:hypothetical protein
VNNFNFTLYYEKTSNQKMEVKNDNSQPKDEQMCKNEILNETEGRKAESEPKNREVSMTIHFVDH